MTIKALLRRSPARCETCGGSIAGLAASQPHESFSRVPPVRLGEIASPYSKSAPVTGSLFEQLRVNCAPICSLT